MTTKNQKLAEDPLFIVFATVLGEWYKDPNARTSVTMAIDVWMDDFCNALEIDAKSHHEFLKIAKKNMELMYWQAILRDVAILPETQSFEVVKVALKLKPPKNFKAGLDGEVRSE